MLGQLSTPMVTHKDVQEHIQGVGCCCIHSEGLTVTLLLTGEGGGELRQMSTPVVMHKDVQDKLKELVEVALKQNPLLDQGLRKGGWRGQEVGTDVNCCGCTSRCRSTSRSWWSCNTAEAMVVTQEGGWGGGCWTSCNILGVWRCTRAYSSTSQRKWTCVC